MGKPLEAIYKSSTTQNVLIGVLAGGLSAEGLTAFIHTVVDAFGGTLPDGYDGALFYVSSVFLIPLMARAMAHVRGWGKKVLGMICVLLCASLVMSGCMTLPAVGGKTKADTTFEDTVQPVVDENGVVTSPGQTTKYTRRVELPAGVELAGNDGMSYNWTGEGAGGIAINQAGNAASMGQASMIGQGWQTQAQAFAGLLQLTGTLAEIAAPLIGMQLQNQQALDLYKLQNPTPGVQDQLIALLSQRLNDPSAGNAWREWLTQMLSGRIAPPAVPTE